MISEKDRFMTFQLELAQIKTPTAPNWIDWSIILNGMPTHRGLFYAKRLDIKFTVFSYFL